MFVQTFSAAIVARRRQCESPFTIRWKNLKTQLYSYGEAYRPHQSISKTEPFENALQTGGI